MRRDQFSGEPDRGWSDLVWGGGEASLLARASVFRRAGQKTIRTVELQCSRALLPSSLFAAARLRPLETLKHSLSTSCSSAGLCFLCTATHSDLFLQPGSLFNVLSEHTCARWGCVSCLFFFFFFPQMSCFFSSFFFIVISSSTQPFGDICSSDSTGPRVYLEYPKTVMSGKVLEILFILISGPLLRRILFMPSI